MRAALLLTLVILSGVAQAAEFEVQLNDGRRAWSSSELLVHPQARDIEIIDDVSYKRTMHYSAVPVSALLEGIEPGDHLQAVALDGFAAELPASILLAREGAKAWLAIEDPEHPWPPLAQGKPSAGQLLPGLDRSFCQPDRPRAVALSGRPDSSAGRCRTALPCPAPGDGCQC